MTKENPAAQLAKLRWKGVSKQHRTEEMRRVANERWKKRRKTRAKASASIDKVAIPIDNI